MEQVPALVWVAELCHHVLFWLPGWGSLEAAALPMSSSGILLVFNPPLPGAGL